MSEFTIFYSWQSDLLRKPTRDVIYHATKEAISRLNTDVGLDDSPRLDHDTLDLSGAPEIAATIFQKIEKSGLFLADLTFVGATIPEDSTRNSKLMPNSNVLLELGYATSKLGWERVILVMNTHYGAADELIFDLRHRRFPITFKSDPNDRKDLEKTKDGLSYKIEEAIRLAIQSEHARVLDVIARLDINGLGWLKEQGAIDRFEPPKRERMGEAIASQRQDDALLRLLDLELIKCDIGESRVISSYRWTYLGKLVLKKLGFRDRCDAVQRGRQ